MPHVVIFSRKEELDRASSQAGPGPRRFSAAPRTAGLRPAGEGCISQGCISQGVLEMSFTKKLYSKKFFLVNLVLVGVLIGFAIAFVSINSGRSAIRAEAPASQGGSQSALAASAPADVKAALSQAVGVQNAFRYVAKSVLPSVVEINVVVSKTADSDQNQLPWHFFFGDPDNQDNQGQNQREYKEEGLGSGIIVRKTGKTVYVLTNNHVAGDASEITVKLYDGREFKATLVGADSRKDLALVKFDTDSNDIVVASLGDSSKLQVGDWAIAVGNPFGLSSSVTYGNVSALGRTGGPDGNISDFIQTDAAINKGNSGGALVNIDGEVIGINTWIASPSGGSIGLGFAIPINNAKTDIDQFISTGKVQYGWLGVSVGDIAGENAKELGIEGRQGAFIAHVFKNGPADRAQLKPGDFVTAIDGHSIKNRDEFIRLVGDIPAGRRAVLSLIRDGKQIQCTATLEVRKDNAGSNNADLFPGLDVLSLNSKDIDQSQLPKGVKGVAVMNVYAKSPAAVMGVKPGDIVTEVNGRKVESLKDFYREVNSDASSKLSFTINREGKTLSTLAYVKK